MAEEKPKPRTILIGMDGSEHAIYAFNWYLKNMHQPDDNVVMAHSVEFHDVLHSSNFYYAPYSFDKEVLNDLLATEAKSIKEKLEHYAEMMRKANVHGTVKSIHSHKPGEGIVQAARDVEADSVIVGCRGIGKIRRTFLGSVSDYVLHHSDVPVVVCRHKDSHSHHHGHNHGHHHEKEHQKKGDVKGAEKMDQ